MSEYKFFDTKFLSAQTKQKILKAWIRFLKSRFSYHNFTNDLYCHLTLHCSFIAHFSRLGFHETYFKDPESTLNFLQQFDSDKGNRSFEYGTSWWLDDEHYKDLNNAMVDEFATLKTGIYKELHKKRLEQAEKAVEISTKRLAMLNSNQ